MQLYSLVVELNSNDGWDNKMIKWTNKWLVVVIEENYKNVSISVIFVGNILCVMYGNKCKKNII